MVLGWGVFTVIFLSVLKTWRRLLRAAGSGQGKNLRSRSDPCRRCRGPMVSVEPRSFSIYNKSI
jgi:hypothetical protein